MIYYISRQSDGHLTRWSSKAMEQEIANQLRDEKLGRTVTVKSSASYADVLALREPDEDRTVLTYLAGTGDGTPKVVARVIPGRNPVSYNLLRDDERKGHIGDLRVHFLKKTDPVC